MKLRNLIKKFIAGPVYVSVPIDGPHRRALFGRLQDICNRNGWDIEECRHALVSMAIGRPVHTFTDLTNAEAEKALDELTFLC